MVLHTHNSFSLHRQAPNDGLRQRRMDALIVALYEQPLWSTTLLLALSIGKR